MSRGAPRVVVTVGTDHHRFDRLIGWMDRWAAAHPEASVLVQHGTADAPAHGDAVVMLGYDELVGAMRDADVVVAQGGPATMMDARSVGIRPIVVPRIARLDEVVDDHQVSFAAWMAERDLVWAVETEAALHELVDAAIADPTMVKIPPDAAASSDTIEAFRGVVDPLVSARAERRRR